MHHRLAISVPALFLTLALGSPAATQAPTEFKLTANDAAASDSFGRSVALSGDTVLVGANGDDDGGSGSGSAYVFVRSGALWIQQDKLAASDAASRDQFGNAVALSGDTALVGAAGNDGPTSSGSAYVFVRSGTTWSQQAKLTASDAAAFDVFGVSVALSGDTALVGATGNSDAGGSSGSAYVFVRSGTTWTEQKKLAATDAAADDRFGVSVALEGNTAVVGAHLDAPMGDGGFSNGPGAAYVFVRSGTSWSQQDKLTASDAAVDDFFGASVALNGDTALVGAPSDDHSGDLNSGSAYVFVRSGTSWSQQDKLTASDAAAQDQFGFSVGLSGDAALVGAQTDDDGGGSSGSAYVFLRSGTNWSEDTKLTASDAASLDEFGTSAALSGDTALVGSHGDDDGGSGAGSAYVYELGLPLALVSQFGAGCAGTLALPVLQPVGGSLPKIATTFNVALSGLPANNRAFLILGLSNTQWLSANLPLSLTPLGAPGCSLLVSGDFFTPVVNTNGTATQGVPIPLDPSLVGLHVYFQGYVEDPGANFFGVAVSNGLDITIGSN